MALLLPMLLAGCGFHIRQAPDLPPQMQRMYIAAPGGNGDLLRELRRGLSSEDTEVLTDPTGANTILSIISVGRSSRPLALDRDGQPLEYQVVNQVAFAMTVDGATTIPPQTVVLTRNYAYSVSNQVANEEQEAVLNKILAKDISQFIIFRVVAAAKNLTQLNAAAESTLAAPAPATQPAAVPASTVPPV